MTARKKTTKAKSTKTGARKRARRPGDRARQALDEGLGRIEKQVPANMRPMVKDVRKNQKKPHCLPSAVRSRCRVVPGAVDEESQPILGPLGEPMPVWRRRDQLQVEDIEVESVERREDSGVRGK